MKDRLDYIEYWIGMSKGDKEYIKGQEDKWSDFLWLGRHLYLKETGKLYDSPSDIINGALKGEKKVMDTYKDDPDFIKYMTNKIPPVPDEEYGDDHWREVCMNVGALRWILSGEWNLDS